MSKYTIDHVCGHSETVQIYGPTKDRQPKADWMAARKCENCYRAEQQAARAKQTEIAATAAQATGLPTLVGSDKQIAWGETIRKSIIEKLAPYENRLMEFSARLGRFEAGTEALPEGKTIEQFAAAKAELAWLSERIPAIKNELTAKWFIDQRAADIRTLLARPQIGG